MRRNTLTIGAAILALVSALYILFGPSIGGSYSEYDDGGRLIREVEGPYSAWTYAGFQAIPPLLPPVALALAGLVAARSRRLTRSAVFLGAAAMLAYCAANLLLSGLGVLPARTGLYFLPTTLLLLVAGFVARRRTATSEPRLNESI